MTRISRLSAHNNCHRSVLNNYRYGHYEVCKQQCDDMIKDPTLPSYHRIMTHIIYAKCHNRQGDSLEKDRHLEIAHDQLSEARLNYSAADEDTKRQFDTLTTCLQNFDQGEDADIFTAGLMKSPDSGVGMTDLPVNLYAPFDDASLGHMDGNALLQPSAMQYQQVALTPTGQMQMLALGPPPNSCTLQPGLYYNPMPAAPAPKPSLFTTLNNFIEMSDHEHFLLGRNHQETGKPHHKHTTSENLLIFPLTGRPAAHLRAIDNYGVEAGLETLCMTKGDLAEPFPVKHIDL